MATLTASEKKKVKFLGIVGSRTFSDDKLFDLVLSMYAPDAIVTGGAEGADTLAEEYAEANDIAKIVFEAEWEKYGKAAGPIRNKLIIDRADEIVAFWDGKSAGTYNAISLAKKFQKPIHVVNY